MDTTLYVGLSKQMILRRELEVAANNIANADTTGFKVESMTVAVDPQTPRGAVGSGKVINYAIDTGLARNFAQGALQQTGAPLDLAVDGDGFFQVSTATGTQYTRDGRFATNAQGQLVTQSGDPVLGASGSPISISLSGGPPSISPDGTISQALPGQAQSQIVGKVGVVGFASLSGLSKTGGGLYSNNGAAPAPSTKSTIRQGMLEASNVQPVLQVTDLIRISRAYDQLSSMMNNAADLSSRSIQRLGSVQ
jgi:flagellar basal-body rod protein FlgF